MSDIESRSPLRHISIRVPWHDNGWDGTVCNQPELNCSCLRLSRISAHRGNSKMANQCGAVRGQRLDQIDEIVDKLLGLTTEEIAEIEGAFKE